MRLLDRLRYAIRARQCSYKTEQAYVYWAREFIRFHNRAHPAEIGGNEVRRFVDNLAVQKHCAAATFRQAMSALVFLYSQVVGKELPWIEGLVTLKGQHEPLSYCPATKWRACWHKWRAHCG